MPHEISPLLDDVQAYETWLRSQCDVVDKDLDAKHARMEESAFAFLRATYFRWSRSVALFVTDLLDAPQALCVGDVHVENYGTWLDADARQVWGLNDFDEAAVMPYPLDLLRLLVSARLAPKPGSTPKSACDAVLNGYADGLKRPGPTLMEQGAPWLRALLDGLEDTTEEFWSEVLKYKTAKRVPVEVARALKASLPAGTSVERLVTRRKGGGSLGRPRYLAIGLWQGGHVLREAKALVPSAWDWANGNGHRESCLLKAAQGKYRSPDASLTVEAGFVIRRVAPDSQKLDMVDVARKGRGPSLLRAMAADLAAVHAAGGNAAKILEDLRKRPTGWLHRAASEAEDFVRNDYRAWKAARV